MALDIKTMPRIFKVEIDGKKQTLADPNIQMSPEQVMSFYATTYPELTTANIKGPSIEEGKAVFKIDTSIGFKG